MPRRNRPPRARRARRARSEEEPEALRAPDVPAPAPEGWQVRIAQPGPKEYRCPGCNQEIRPGTKHVVAWEEGREDERRHWHSPCWTRAHPR